MSKNPNRKLSAKNVTQLFTGAAALTFVIGGGLIFWLHDGLSAEQAKQANLQSQVGSSEKIAKRLQDTLTAYSQTCAKIAVLETSVTQKSYVPTLLQQIQRLAGETNLSIATLHPGLITSAAPPVAAVKTDGGDAASDTAKKKPVAAPAYSTMDVTLNVTGTYADTARFLYGLTRFPKILSVVSVQMTPSSVGPTGSGPQAAAGAAPQVATGDAPQVTTALKLTAYIFPDAAPDASSPAPNAGGTVQTASAPMPPAAAPTLAGAAGRAAQGAVAATQDANGHAVRAAQVL